MSDDIKGGAGQAPATGPVTTSGGVPVEVANPLYKVKPAAPTLTNADGKLYDKHVEERDAAKVAEEERFKNDLIQKATAYPGAPAAGQNVAILMASCGPTALVASVVAALDDAADCAHKRGHPLTQGKFKAQANALRPLILAMAELETLGQ